MEAQKKLRSPFSTDPIIDSDGVIHECHIRPPDDRRFAVMARFEYLTIPYIAALTAEHPIAVRRRLRETKAEPGRWVKNADWQCEDAHARRKHKLSEKVFELNDPAIVRLQDKGIPVIRNEFTGPDWHRLMSCQVRADFDYGTTLVPDVRIIPFDEMQRDPRMPEPGRQLKSFIFPATNAGRATTLRFDCHPFIIERSKMKNPHLLIIGIEIDRGTMSQKSEDTFRSSIRRKITEQIELLKSGLIKERFGFPFGYIIYVNSSPTRLRGFMEEVKDLTREKPSLRRSFLFQTHTDSTDKPVPTGYMLTKAYERVEYPPLSLIA